MAPSETDRPRILGRIRSTWERRRRGARIRDLERLVDHLVQACDRSGERALGDLVSLTFAMWHQGGGERAHQVLADEAARQLRERLETEGR